MDLWIYGFMDLWINEFMVMFYELIEIVIIPIIIEIAPKICGIFILYGRFSITSIIVSIIIVKINDEDIIAVNIPKLIGFELLSL